MVGATNGKRRQSRSGQEKLFQPAIGREFEGVQEVDAKTRAFLARLIGSTTVAGVLATGGYGLITGNYTAVIGVWSVAGPIIGALMAHYFGPQRNDTG
jgi:hypothetical protein